MKALPIIPIPQLDLPGWPEDMRDAWDVRASHATILTRGVGSGRHFDALLADARRLLLADDLVTLSARLDDRRYLRAVVTAWLADTVLARDTMSPHLIRHMCSRPRPSRLTAITIAVLFFTHFDRLDTWQEGLFLAVRDLLRAAVAMQPSAKRRDVIGSIREHEGFLLERDGPTRLAGTLLFSGDDVNSWFRTNHLGGLSDTRLGRIARDAFYLATIEAADAEHGEHAFLQAITSEIVARQRAESTEEDQRYFGHQVLTALTSKTTRHPSSAWLEAALTIGGDPRLSQTQAWQTWWSRVPEKNVARASAWMRGADLRAFLDGVEDYARANSNESMLRMLDRRKRLLVGLYEQDRIEDVRLILGTDIRRWIRRSTRFALVDEAYLQDAGKQDTAVIYVDCGDFCLVEGSHNFKIHLYLGGPLERLADRRVLHFDGFDLRETLPARHQATYGRDSYLGVAHQGGEWIRKSLDFLRERGVVLDERGLLSANDYADLTRRRASHWY